MHLISCVAPGPQHHHSQGGGDAEGGEEDVGGLVFIAQLPQQSLGEGSVGLGQRGW